METKETERDEEGIGGSLRKISSRSSSQSTWSISNLMLFLLLLFYTLFLFLLLLFLLLMMFFVNALFEEHIFVFLACREREREWELKLVRCFISCLSR